MSGSQGVRAFVNEPLSPVSEPSNTDNNGGGFGRHSDSQQLDVRGSRPSSITIDSLLTTAPFTEDRKRDLPLVDWDGYFATKHVSAGRKHLALLRHFRYTTVPWMEAGDLSSTFGTDIMRLAQEHPPIQSVILDLSANQVALIRQQRDAADGQTQKTRMRALEGPARRIADSLSGITEYLQSGPSQWRSRAAREMGLVGPDTTALSIEEPLRTLCKLHSRFDLASSIILRQRPLTPKSFYSPQGFPPAWNPECPGAAYLWSMHHLTVALHLVHDASLPLPQPLLQDSMCTPPHSSTWAAKWLAVWTSCQAWRDRRPATMRPALDMGSLEAEAEASASASLPVQLYTHALAMQANAAYHLCSLLLLAGKPRLLHRRLPGLAAASSRGWHVRTLAGMACANDLAEQWDPVLVAGLLLAAREVTHPAQQDAVRACVRRMRAATGIGVGVEGEVAELEALWGAGRC
ncbi:Fungal transcriptional regulatory protein, partial [Metarhizium hybridum]